LDLGVPTSGKLKSASGFPNYPSDLKTSLLADRDCPDVFRMRFRCHKGNLSAKWFHHSPWNEALALNFADLFGLAEVSIPSTRSLGQGIEVVVPLAMHGIVRPATRRPLLELSSHPCSADVPLASGGLDRRRGPFTPVPRETAIRQAVG
jgi:hypothetical protein